MTHDELMELATQELAAQKLAAVLEQIERRGTCQLSVAALLVMVAQGMVRDGAEHRSRIDCQH